MVVSHFFTPEKYEAAGTLSLKKSKGAKTLKKTRWKWSNGIRHSRNKATALGRNRFEVFYLKWGM